MNTLGTIKVLLVAVVIDDRVRNKAGYTATQVACGWAGAIFEVASSFGKEL